MKILKLLVALLPASGFVATAAVAAPLPRMDAVAPAAEALPVEKVHGWHGHCAWGPARYHRHIPGVGNVACGYPRYSYYGGPYVRSWRWDPPRRHWHHGYRSHHRHWR